MTTNSDKRREKDMESETGQLDVPVEGQQFLLPVVVLRKIFEDFSNADLLNLSLVNKVLNYETRSLLRDRGSLTARMNTDDGKCKDLRAFALDLRRMREVKKIVPFSGLTISVSGAEEQHGDWCNALSTEEMDEVYVDILHHMEWKHLALHLTHHWDRKENCAGLELVKTILHNCCCILEEFSLEITSGQEAFIQHFLQDCNFPRLKTMKFQGRYRGGDDLIKSPVARTSNLQVLCTKGRVNLRANLLEGSSAVHVTDHPYYLPDDPDIPESIFGKLRLQQMLLGSRSEDFDLERFNRIVPVLLQASRTTLRSMGFKAVYLAPLMHYGICLENMRALSVALHDFDVSQPRTRRLLKSFDSNRIFPNLTSVRISCYVDEYLHNEHVWNAFIDMFEQGNVALIEPVNRSVNISQLTVSWCSRVRNREACVRLLVEVFPAIKKIVINARDVPFVRFWDYWLDLEELDIRLRGYTEVHENLDSAFCGIFPQEVAELRERDEEYLKKVNIVPVMPSLACLKRLKTFTLYFAEDTFFNDPTSMPSKVTGLIAFKRRPDLTVTLATNRIWWQRELRHMEPYASVQLTDRS